MKILILCSDNSCLSQMAQGWLQSFDKSLTVCSAGISPAIEVHPLAVQTLASSGIDISHHKPEAVEEYIDEPWDYVITVSRDAEENCPAFTGKVRNLIHSNFYNPTRAKGTPESIANEFRRRIRTDLYLWREPVLQMQLAAIGALLLDIPFPLQSLQEVIVGIVQRDIYFSIMRNASDTMHQQEVSIRSQFSPVSRRSQTFHDPVGIRLIRLRFRHIHRTDLIQSGGDTSGS